MKNKKGMSIRLRKMSIANLSQLKGGYQATENTFTCSQPKECPTTLDPRTEIGLPSGEC